MITYKNIDYKNLETLYNLVVPAPNVSLATFYNRVDAGFNYSDALYLLNSSHPIGFTVSGITFINLKEFCSTYKLNESKVNIIFHNCDNELGKTIITCAERFGLYIYKGKIYRNLSKLCKENSLEYKLMYYRIRRGISVEDTAELPKFYRDLGCTFNGVSIYNVKKLASELDLPYNKLLDLHSNGICLDRCIKLLVDNKLEKKLIVSEVIKENL